jgi:nucleoside-diphosphate-sugar epimerase
MLCATKGTAGEVYNLANGVETSILQLATAVNEMTENPTPIEFLPPRTWDHSGKRFGSTEKSKRTLGLEPEVDVREGLRRTIDWTRENLSLIDACIEKHRQHLKVAAAQTGRP